MALERAIHRITFIVAQTITSVKEGSTGTGNFNAPQKATDREHYTTAI
jgi:hypothetical protein